MARKHRAVLSAGSSLLASMFLVTSCAQTHGGHNAPPPLDAAIEAYSRNQIVCVPTAVGNILGVIVDWAVIVAALPVTLPIVLMVDKRDPSPRAGDDDSIFVKAGLGVLMFPVLLIGGVVGTPFLPFSYLAPESRCNFGW
jgi:hypothetical protein